MPVQWCVISQDIEFSSFSSFTTITSPAQLTVFALLIFQISAIFTGNDAAFKYAIQAISINPYIGCILQPLLNKILSMIVITYTNETLDRAIKFLSAIVYNYNSREATANCQLLNMSQLLSCLLLGPLDLNEHLNDEQKKMEEKINQIAGELEQCPTTNNIFHNLDGMQSHIKTTSLSDQMDFVKQEDMYYEDIKELEPTTSYSTVDDFQAVMQIMRNEGFDKMDGVGGGAACKKPKIKHELKDNAYEFEIGTSYEVQVIFFFHFSQLDNCSLVHCIGPGAYTRFSVLSITFLYLPVFTATYFRTCNRWQNVPRN